MTLNDPKGRIPIEKPLKDILDYFEREDALEKQRTDIAQVKKKRALGAVGIGIAIIVVAGIATVYGIADVMLGARLPMGLLFLVGGPVGILAGVFIVSSGCSRASAASQFSFEGDLEKVCHIFYSSAFCRQTTDLQTKEAQLVEVCQFLPAPVAEFYMARGWSRLGDRWMKLRSKKTSEDGDFTLASLSIDKTQRDDPRIVDVTIRLSGKPFGSITLYNIAINAGGMWFLATPKPITSL